MLYANLTEVRAHDPILTKSARTKAPAARHLHVVGGGKENPPKQVFAPRRWLVWSTIGGLVLLALGAVMPAGYWKEASSDGSLAASKRAQSEYRMQIPAAPSRAHVQELLSARASELRNISVVDHRDLTFADAPEKNPR